ncbi:hypothetical protein BCR41DRAFT_359869 [Lobosporangium transversale]|uniref:Uncharacterized protein n=1 Tax=Lobosporangium transversale TaxID=64571 RepID=A0A1Y2GDY6_9FUNG|nr:hypothetical protein BCR41DRAFT_359869 [Lobosporangium transversale]ORZ08072.1 hypothetical protein BCR41DRAFT_359869 [Lobosporangium transversale]|eukprot:XP_021878306.1 hypothetical protein BCR41DRAFT_359869 [Lobosporangium transversale]
MPLSFQDPSILGRRVALPGTRSGAKILTNQQSRKFVADIFGCRLDELRLLQDSDRARKPDKIQDLESFLELYEWLEFLPGAEMDEPTAAAPLMPPLPSPARSSAPVVSSCGRKEGTLLALIMNFGSIAESAKEQPVEMKQWLIQRIERLVQHGALLRVGEEKKLIRINPALVRQFRKFDQKSNNNENKNSWSSLN